MYPVLLWKPLSVRNNKSPFTRSRLSAPVEAVGVYHITFPVAYSRGGRKKKHTQKQKTMRDLIVKINMDQHSVASDQVLTNQMANLDDPGVRSLKENEGADSDSDGSDSGTAGTPTSQSFWPDLEVLDPDHPM